MDKHFIGVLDYNTMVLAVPDGKVLVGFVCVVVCMFQMEAYESFRGCRDAWQQSLNHTTNVYGN